MKKFWDVNFFVMNVLIPIIVLILYDFTFSYFSSHILLKGVNYFFTFGTLQYGLILIAGLYFVFFLMYKLRKDDPVVFRNTNDRFLASDLLLLLLPLTPVVQYIFINQDILPPLQSLLVFVFFLLLAFVYIYIIPVLLGIIASTRILMLTGVTFITTINSMPLLSSQFHWYENGSLWVQWVFMGGIFLITWLIYRLNYQRLLYIAIAFLFFGNGTIQFFSSRSVTIGEHQILEENKLLLTVKDRIPAASPNVYLLLYDAYAHNETMLGYGIDNSAQENFLVNSGFTLYPQTYSIGQSTVESMSRVLNASTEFYGVKRRAVSGDGVVQKIFRNLGYEVDGLFTFDFMFYGIGSSYDQSVPESRYPTGINLITSVLIGEFRDDVEFYHVSKPQFLETKRNFFENTAASPRFIYMQTNVPKHSQHSGVCRPNEIELYAERLIRANDEMKQDVKVIIESDPQAIIIVAGDHGPYLSKNCASLTGIFDISEITRFDIQDRFGTFLAIRWPTGDYTKYDAITVLQDVFPAVFAYIYRDPLILESKIDPIILTPNRISGATVINGIISGGFNDGEPLFLTGR